MRPIGLMHEFTRDNKRKARFTRFDREAEVAEAPPINASPEFIMKRLFTMLVGVVACGAALPAFAGPDWQAIEQARKHKQAQFAEACAAKRLVLPLDHGPRAQTTPYLNEQRRQRFEGELAACREAAVKAPRQ